MLQEEGQYSELCENNVRPSHDGSVSDSGNEMCNARINQFQRIFEAATLMVSLLSLPAGSILDYAGTSVTLLIAGVFEITGCVLMALADSKTFDVFLLAYSALGIGGTFTTFAAFSGVSGIATEAQWMYNASVSCLFDASVVIFQIFYGLKCLGLSRFQLFSTYALIAAVVYMSIIMNYIRMNANGPPNNEADISIMIDPNNQGRSTYGSIDKDEEEDADRKVSTEACLGDEQWDFWSQLKSFDFFYMLIICSIGILRANVFIAMNPLLLDSYGDRTDHNNAYKQIFTYVLASGFIFIPLIEFCGSYAGLMKTLQITNGLGIFAFGLGMVPNIYVQLLTFFVFTAFRAFLYSVVSIYNVNVFGKETFGKIQGLMFTIGALINLLQEPLIRWANTTYHGSMNGVCVVGILLGLFVLVFTEVIQLATGWIPHGVNDDEEDYQ